MRSPRFRGKQLFHFRENPPVEVSGRVALPPAMGADGGSVGVWLGSDPDTVPQPRRSQTPALRLLLCCWLCPCFMERTMDWPTRPRERKPYICDDNGGHFCFFQFSLFGPQLFIHKDSPGEFNEMWRITHLAAITTQSSS